MSAVRPTPDELARFWSRVDTSGGGCWLWAGGLLNSGYGRFSFRGRTTSAHRLALAFATGHIPDGCLACHHCDVKACVRPSHLFWGTASDNMMDMVNKGRHGRCSVKGTTNGNSRWTEDDVRAVRQLRSEGLTYRAISERLGVPKGTVEMMVNRRTWAYLDALEDQESR